MSTQPNSITGSSIGTILWSTATHQFGVWYTLDSELRIGRIERGVERWGIDHDEYQVGGTPRTVLELPASDDEHNAPAIAVDGNGRIHVWANMHTDNYKAIRSVDPHTSNTWMADSGWVNAVSELPSVETRTTYPIPVALPDGRLWFYLRTGSGLTQSGRGDSFFWTRAATGTTWSARTRIFQGVSVPEAGGPGIPGSDDTVDDFSNWNSYPTIPVVEGPNHPYPGRMHMSWIWRQLALEVGGGPGAETSIIPSYAYSDDGGNAWFAVDGTPLTLPIHPLNNYACQMPFGSGLIRTIVRSSNVVTAELHRSAADLKIIVGDDLVVRNNTTSFEGTFDVTSVGSPNPTTVTWAQTGSNETGSVGSVTKRTYTSWGSIICDRVGIPHILGSVGPTLHIYYQNGQWVETSVPQTIDGMVHAGYMIAVHTRGRLWGVSRAAPGTIPRLRVFALEGTAQYATMSGLSGINYDPCIDPEAQRRWGAVECLVPDGNVPKVFRLGSGARVAEG